MDYKDALSACIDAVRAGEEPRHAIAAYPEHAARLLEDVNLIGAVRLYAATSAQPSEAATARARQRFAADLESARTARRPAAASRGSARFLMAVPQYALAAAIAVIAIGLLAVATGVLTTASTAQAQSLDGVVVEKNATSLLLQTEDGLQTIDLDDGSSVTDETGATLNPQALEPGQLIAVRAQKQAKGALRALTVERRAADSLADWCRLHPVRCQEVEPRLPEGAIGCRLNAGACPPWATPAAAAIQPAGVDERPRLQDLANRCQQKGGDACDELRRYCRANPGVCAVVAGWLRSLIDLPDDVRERLRLHAQRCHDGSILDCRELRLLCERLSEPCPALTPQRPRADATPVRNTPLQATPGPRQLLSTPVRQQQQLPTAPPQRRP